MRGATHGNIGRMVVRQGIELVTIALIIGIAGALAIGRALRSLLFATSPNDPATYAVGVSVLTSVALLACWIPQGEQAPRSRTGRPVRVRWLQSLPIDH